MNWRLPERPLDLMRHTRQARVDRDEARHLALVEHRAVVVELYPERYRTGDVTAAPVKAPIVYSDEELEVMFPWRRRSRELLEEKAARRAADGTLPPAA